MINPEKDKTEVINEVIKSKLSHIAVKKRGRIEKKRGRIEKPLEIINENPSVASDSIAVQLE